MSTQDKLLEALDKAILEAEDAMKNLDKATKELAQEMQRVMPHALKIPIDISKN